MNRYTTRHRVPFTPQQMYALVADVERYPEFLPLCESLTVKSREPREHGETVVATMSVGYKAIRESFTSRVTLEPAIPRVLVTALDGPFSALDNRWLFHAAAGGRACEIEFLIVYEFRSFLLQAVMGGLFQQAIEKYTAAFEQRAGVVYGKAPVSFAPPRS